MEAPGAAEEALGLPEALGQGEEEGGEAQAGRVGELPPAASAAGGAEGEAALGERGDRVAQEDLEDVFPLLRGEASVRAGGHGQDLPGVFHQALGVEEARRELNVLPRGAEDDP